MKYGIFWCLVCFCVLFSLPVRIFASNSWTRSTSSPNFTLVGNADEREIRFVGIQLEQFRETFQQLFPDRKFNQSPVTVIVFKNAQELKSFEPVDAGGKAGDLAQNYFLAGEEANYIVLSANGESKIELQSVFHDYVHFILNQNFGRAVIPPWVNEGLAEYYQTFRSVDEKNLGLGEAAEGNLQLLREQPLIPFERFFALDYYTLRNQGNHPKSIFYAESWALFHYLQDGNQGARREQLKTFLNLLLEHQSPDTAFAKAFQTDYAAMEKELKSYLQQSLTNKIVSLKNKPKSDSQKQAETLTETDAISYQADLLLHLNRLDEAANLLRQAIALDAKNPFANALLGATLVRQNKFDEARPVFEKAVSLASDNYLPYFYYADALRREAAPDENFVRPFSNQQTLRINELLDRTIELNPDFAEALRLSAFVNYANNSDLSAAQEMLRKALLLEPGNERYALDLGRIFYRQEKFDEARSLARKVLASAEEASVRADAQVLLNNVNSLEEQLKEIRERNARKTNLPTPRIELSPEELINQSLNEALRKPKPGEKRVVGYLSNIDCGDNEINFLVRPKDQTANQTLKLRANDFLSVAFMAFTVEASGKPVGCGIRKAEDFVVVTYRPPSSETKTNFDGAIVAVEFVPKTFMPEFKS